VSYFRHNWAARAFRKCLNWRGFSWVCDKTAQLLRVMLMFAPQANFRITVFNRRRLCIQTGVSEKTTFFICRGACPSLV